VQLPGGRMQVGNKKDFRFNLSTTKSQKDYVEKQASMLGISASEFLRKLIESHREEHKKNALRQAAEALADDYRNDSELTVFTEIDGDPFL
jgi:hypothetical protein